MVALHPVFHSVPMKWVSGQRTPPPPCPIDKSGAWRARPELKSKEAVMLSDSQASGCHL